MGRPRKITDRKTPFINQREIADEFGGMTSQQILRWVARGQFPLPVKIIGTTRLFDRSEVEKFLRSRDPVQRSSLATSDVSAEIS